MRKITENEAHEMYNEMLDDNYGDFMGAYPASRVLAEVDPIAYHGGFNDYRAMLEENGYEIGEG